MVTGNLTERGAISCPVIHLCKNPNVSSSTISAEADEGPTLGKLP